MLECVINVSEGRRAELIAAIAASAGADLLDVHSDGAHNRSVLTVVGTEAARNIARATVGALDLRTHDGVHPRIGVLDVVPFVPLGDTTMSDAVAARNQFGEWATRELGLPCFHYGPERTLPDVRREAFKTLLPDHGPATPHPTAGAVAIGARPLLVAYNLWLEIRDLPLAKRIAAGLRGPSARALGLAVGDQVQVSMNLIDPAVVGPADVYDRVAAITPISRAELVGLIPAAVIRAIDPARWDQLDLALDRTIEARLDIRPPRAKRSGLGAGDATL